MYRSITCALICSPGAGSQSLESCDRATGANSTGITQHWNILSWARPNFITLPFLCRELAAPN